MNACECGNKPLPGGRLCGTCAAYEEKNNQRSVGEPDSGLTEYRWHEPRRRSELERDLIEV